VKSTCNDNDEESSSSPPNQELEDTETIPPIIVNEVNEQVIEMISRLNQIFFSAFPMTNLIYMRRMGYHD
jgi:hypothetical protein